MLPTSTADPCPRRAHWPQATGHWHRRRRRRSGCFGRSCLHLRLRLRRFGCTSPLGSGRARAAYLAECRADLKQAGGQAGMCRRRADWPGARGPLIVRALSLSRSLAWGQTSQRSQRSKWRPAANCPTRAASECLPGPVNKRALAGPTRSSRLAACGSLLGRAQICARSR